MSQVEIIDVPKLIDRGRMSRFQVLVVALCFLALLIDGFDLQVIGYVAPALRQALHISPQALGVVFSAGLLGIMAGALLSGTLADIFGRKPVIILSLLFVGLTTLGTAMAVTVKAFVILRFVTGIGLGGVMPNGYALTAEYSPTRSRATAMMMMCTGFSMGAVVGGLLAEQMIPAFGWRSVFYFGGVVSLAIAAVLIFALPESIRYLVLKGGDASKTAAILKRVDPNNVFTPDAQFVVREENRSDFPVRYLFTEGRTGVTVLLWTINALCLIDLYFLTNWLPTVVLSSGLTMQRAVLAGTTFQLGGTIGAVALGRLIDKSGYYRVLGTAFAIASVAIAAIGAVGPIIWAIMSFAFLAGFCVIGAQIGMNALAAAYYPTFIRSTGVGWALGIGRLGSIAGTLTAGILLALHWTNARLFLLAALPALVAAGAVWTLKIATSAKRPGAGSVVGEAGIETAVLPGI